MKRILLILILVILAGCGKDNSPRPEASSRVYDLGFVFSQHLNIKQNLDPFNFAATQDEIKEYINKLPASPVSLQEGQSPNPRFEGMITYSQYKFGDTTITFRFGEKDWEGRLISIQAFSQPETPLLSIGPAEEKTQLHQELEKKLGSEDLKRNYFFRASDGNRRELQSQEHVWERPWAQIWYYLKPGPVDIVEYWNPAFLEERKNFDTQTSVSK